MGLRENLESGVYEITFNKISGNKRKMKCTRMKKYIPSCISDENNDIITVWDIEKNDWRSIRSNSIEGVLYVHD